MRYEQKIKRYVKEANINMESRKQEHLFRRYYLMLFLREKTTLSLASIAWVFKKNHATVIHALKEVKNLANDENYQMYTEREREAFPMYLSEEHLKEDHLDPLLISKSLQYLESKIFKHG